MSELPVNELFFENAYDAEDTPTHSKFVTLINKNGKLKLHEKDCIMLGENKYTIIKIVQDESKGEPSCICIELNDGSDIESTDSRLKNLSLCSSGGKKKKTKRRKPKKKTKRR